MEEYPILNLYSSSNKKTELLIYPNPAKENITLLGLTGQETKYEIIDICGKSIQSGQLHGTGIEQNIPFNGPNGFYFLQVYSSDKIVSIQLQIKI